mgnify:CR=1 FL=1
MEDLKRWEYFCDSSYYDKWAVRDKADRSFHSAIHVGTKEEAEFLANSLNELLTLQDRYNEMEKVLEEYAPMALLKLKLEKQNLNVEYELYTAQRKCGDTSDMDEEWEYVDFNRGDYIEQTLYRRKALTELKAKEA